MTWLVTILIFRDIDRSIVKYIISGRVYYAQVVE